MLTTLLSFSGCVVLLVSLFLTIQTRFVQIRKLPELIRLFFNKQSREEEGTINSRKALLTAMSTTIGLSTMVAPVIAIRLGGPAAVVGFFLATLLGAATSYAEVTFAMQYRKKQNGVVSGGPMQYLQDAFAPWLAKWYAAGCGILMLVWSAAQSNQIAGLFNSSMMGSAKISPWISGVLLAISVCVILIGGIKRIAALSVRLVPIMFILYLGASLWIILLNCHKLPGIFSLIIHNCFYPQSFGSGIVVGGVLSAFRWGVLKGLQGNEAGVGTQTIPHSAAEVTSASEQGILAMASTYCAGIVMIISSLTALISMTWLDPQYNLGIDMVVGTYQQTFSFYGAILVAISALLFAFGTVLGNSYNGSQCFLFLTKGKGLLLYYGITAVMILLGAVGSVQMVWSYIDIVLVCVTIPHILAIFWLSWQQRKLLAIAA